MGGIIDPNKKVFKWIFDLYDRLVLQKRLRRAHLVHGFAKIRIKEFNDIPLSEDELAWKEKMRDFMQKDHNNIPDQHKSNSLNYLDDSIRRLVQREEPKSLEEFYGLSESNIDKFYGLQQTEKQICRT